MIEKMYRFLLIFLLFSSNFFAQNSKKVKKYKIKSVFEIQMDTLSIDSKEMFTESIKKFDKNGNLVYEEEYSKKRKFKKKKEYKYNKNDQLVEEIIYDEKGVLSIEKLEYDLDLLTKISLFDAKNELISQTDFKYNGFKEKTEEIKKDKNGNIVEKTVFEYNNSSLKVSKKVYNNKGRLIEYKLYKYEY
jgi:hypothetical protein